MTTTPGLGGAPDCLVPEDSPCEALAGPDGFWGGTTRDYGSPAGGLDLLVGVGLVEWGLGSGGRDERYWEREGTTQAVPDGAGGWDDRGHSKGTSSEGIHPSTDVTSFGMTAHLHTTSFVFSETVDVGAATAHVARGTGRATLIRAQRAGVFLNR